MISGKMTLVTLVTIDYTHLAKGLWKRRRRAPTEPRLYLPSAAEEAEVDSLVNRLKNLGYIQE
jgi:hypothetical protein